MYLYHSPRSQMGTREKRSRSVLVQSVQTWQTAKRGKLVSICLGWEGVCPSHARHLDRDHRADFISVAKPLGSPLLLDCQTCPRPTEKQREWMLTDRSLLTGDPKRTQCPFISPFVTGLLSQIPRPVHRDPPHSTLSPFTLSRTRAGQRQGAPPQGP